MVISGWIKVGIITSFIYSLLTIISIIISVLLKKLTPLPYIVAFINPFYSLLFFKSFPLENFLSLQFHIYILITGIIFYFIVGAFLTWLNEKIKEGEY